MSGIIRSLASLPRQPYRLLTKGRGGLVYFYQETCPTRPPPNDPTFIEHIGMYRCLTSSGVCFALSEQGCFAAHINAWVRNHNSPNTRQTITPEEGTKLKDQIMARLHSTLMPMGHNVTNVGVTKPYTKRSLLIMNPNMYHFAGKTQIGFYVAQAVYQYLDLKEEDYPVDRKHSGFVLQHLQQPIKVSLKGSQTNGNLPPSDLGFYEEREEEGEHIGDWTFEIKETAEQAEVRMEEEEKHAEEMKVLYAE